MIAPESQPGRRQIVGAATLLGPTWLVLGGLCLLPLTILLLVSFLQRDRFGTYRPVEDWGAYLRSGKFLANYARSLDPLYMRIFLRSFWIAAVTTVLCAVIGYPVAYYIALVAPRRWKNALLVAVVVPFWTSFLIRTYAWVVILQDEGLVNAILTACRLTRGPLHLLYTNGAVMAGLVYGELPFMILPLYASLEKLDRSLLEAAADLGAGSWATLRRVTIPLTAPGLVAGTVLVFIPSIGQFIVSDLLGGAKAQLIGNVVQQQFTSGRDKPFGAALAFELAAVVLMMLLVYALYAKKRGADAML